MTAVYVLQHSDWEERPIIGVFTSLAEAQAVLTQVCPSAMPLVRNVQDTLWETFGAPTGRDSRLHYTVTSFPLNKQVLATEEIA